MVVVALLDAGVVALPVWRRWDLDVGAVALPEGRQWDLDQLLAGGGHVREARARDDPGIVQCVSLSMFLGGFDGNLSVVAVLG